MIKHEFLCVTTNFYKELSDYMIYEKAMLKDSHFYCKESYSVKKKKKSNMKPASSQDDQLKTCIYHYLSPNFKGLKNK